MEPRSGPEGGLYRDSGSGSQRVVALGLVLLADVVLDVILFPGVLWTKWRPGKEPASLTLTPAPF